MKKQGQSVIDTFLELIPHLRKNDKGSMNYISSMSARTLFNIWRAGKINNEKKYTRPGNVVLSELQNMQKQGLIKVVGNTIEMTQKGSDVIRVMILGDDRSSFDKEDFIIDYNQALSNTKNVKIGKKGQKVANNWWDRFSQ
ncbi:hypothetical protein LCGC14_1543620 [marine sediment metagenome]|uniref:Uncharacterized protein n=1 Tax=marine sediment metagenome TaxID=412755 RepID=A0A0F9LT57_9ZZZZ